MRKMATLRFIFSLILILFTSKTQTSSVSGLGNGWIFSSLRSSRAYLYTQHSMSWAEAEDFCQMVYGHLATDDSDEELRDFLDREKISGAVWIGLHQSRPQTQFTWTNDFDWSEVSMSPGDGWGEYVEEYEAALCVSLDIDHGYRWDTRYCQGVMVAGTVCQIQVPMWVRDGRCRITEEGENITLRYYPDKEIVQWNAEGGQKTKLCSIEDKFEQIFLVEKEYSSNRTKEKTEENVHNQTEKSSKDQIAIIAKKNSSLDITAEATDKIILNKTSEDRTLEDEKVTQNGLNKTNQSEDKLTVTVRFEVKNNTNLLHIGNVQRDQKFEKNNSLQNIKETSSSYNLSIMNTTLFSHNVSRTNSVQNDTISITTRKESSSITSSSPSSSTATTLLNSSDSVSNLGTTIPSTLKKRGQNSEIIKDDESTQKIEFSDLAKVTNVWLTTPVTPSILNSTVQSSLKVSISSNISDTSTATEIDKTGSTDDHPQMSSTTIDQTISVTPALKRLKRSNGHKKSQIKKKSNFVVNSRNNRQQLLRETREILFGKKGA